MLYNRDTSTQSFTGGSTLKTRRNFDMKESFVVLVEGEVLLNHRDRTFDEQYRNAFNLAEGLSGIIEDGSDLVLLCDNHPHVGYVLYRSELSSHLLHSVPLDVAIADSQGAIGYLLARAFTNMLLKHDVQRQVSSIFTQSLVDANHDVEQTPVRAIGPYFDRERAEQYRRTRGWTIVEEPGYGFRRAVHSLPPLEIIEMEEIKALVSRGNIVIAGGGGGIPVFHDENGELVGAEELVDPEATAFMMAKGIQADHLWMIVSRENGFLSNGIRLSTHNEMSLAQLEDLLQGGKIHSPSVLSKLSVADQFIRNGGKQVIFTTSSQLNQVGSEQKGVILCK